MSFSADGIFADPGPIMVALRALRPSTAPVTQASLGAAIGEFAAGLGALRHSLVVAERGPRANTIRWQCDDDKGWWEPLRFEYRRLLAMPADPSRIRTCRYLRGAAPAAVDAVLGGIGAHSLFVAVAETVPAGPTLACLSLAFGRGSACAREGVQPLLKEVGHHAAALMLDAYLGLPGARADGVRLSAREGECLHWAAAGKTSWETACILGVRERTVNFHLGNAFTKLKVNNKQAAVAQAIKQGLLTV